MGTTKERLARKKAQYQLAAGPTGEVVGPQDKGTTARELPEQPQLVDGQTRHLVNEVIKAEEVTATELPAAESSPEPVTAPEPKLEDDGDTA